VEKETNKKSRINHLRRFALRYGEGGENVELMSRVERHKVEKRKQWDLSWALGIALFGFLVYPLQYFFLIPEDLQYKQTMQILLFLTSILFLSLYLLAFTVASTRTFVQREEKVSRINYTILVLWVISLLYHFTIWLTSHSQLPPIVYHIGLALTLSAFILTLIHFAAYFTFVRKDYHVQLKKQSVDYRKEAYESLQRILHTHRVLLDIMEENPEVKQMMKWNGFDQQMDHWVGEMEEYLHVTAFTDQELRNILGVKAWIDNLTMIVEQHPLHHDLRKKLN